MRQLAITGKAGILGMLLLDDCDADITEGRRINVAGGRGKMYPSIKRNGERIIVHKEVAGRMGIEGSVDHISRDTCDARRCNLRAATQGQNRRNASVAVTNTSGLKGVTWYKKYGKWLAQIKHNGKNHNLGYFKNRLEAGRVHDAKAIELFGDFAATNKSLGLL